MTFPGHVDLGENAREAAVRETMEEAGLKTNDYEIDETFEWKLNYEVRRFTSSFDKSLTFSGKKQTKGGHILAGAIERG